MDGRDSCEGKHVVEGMISMRGRYRRIQEFIPPTIPCKNPVLRSLCNQFDHLPHKGLIRFMQILLNHWAIQLQTGVKKSKPLCTTCANCTPCSGGVWDAFQFCVHRVVWREGVFSGVILGAHWGKGDGTQARRDREVEEFKFGVNIYVNLRREVYENADVWPWMSDCVLSVSQLRLAYNRERGAQWQHDKLDKRTDAQTKNKSNYKLHVQILSPCITTQ